ncbi:dUTP diphosphatase [Lysinibacillus capsici]|uniref:dUTP diphosphatase n=1 Tax=Lysinibacillus capsici TaxID=2115968 RepID=UPI0028BE59B5|nr:dUTP diphosphatase [Lysinibacillus capsici]WNN77750.1 dUTP diphosphatase [Lysinibacillus capsici]
MNLTKLFETQAALDKHIMQEHPELRGQNNLDWKLLALQVELGECANEWRGFKKWSKDQEPRTCVSIEACRNCGGTGNAFGVPEEAGIGCWDCNGTGEITKNPFLEEYVDCLHFILSVGLDLQVQHDYIFDFNRDDEESIIDLFAECYAFAGDLYWNSKNGSTITESQNDYQTLLFHFNHLGRKLGFTWEEVEEAYYAKNKVNHDRQESGY